MRSLFSGDWSRILQIVYQESQGVPVFLVGGAVRDHFLGVQSHDLDFCLDSSPIPLARRVASVLNAGIFLLDEERETVRVVIKQSDTLYTYLDFARFREGSLEADLRKRDFTINAIALPVHESFSGVSVIDPCGGMNDLHEKVLRACSVSSFEEDPVRVLRLVRFAQKLQFRIDPQTLKDARNAVPYLERVSAERKRDEIFQILEGPRTHLGIELLDYLNALPFVFPELEKIKGVPQSPPHVHDVWRHTIETINRLEILLKVLASDLSEHSPSGMFVAQASLWLGRFREHFKSHFRKRLNPLRTLKGLTFFSALYHDIGKAETVQEDDKGRIRFYNHEKVSEQSVVFRGHALALSNEEVEHIQKVISGHMRIHWLAAENREPSRKTIYRFFREFGDAGVDICLLSLADLWATYSHTLTVEKWVEELMVCRTLLEARWEQESSLIKPPVLVNGNDLIKELQLQPGPVIGKLLEAIREAQVEGLVTDKESALSYAQEWIRSSFPHLKEEV